MKKITKKINWLGWTCLLAGVITAAGCSKYSYKAVKNENVNFNNYRTFAWIYAGDSTNSFYRNDIAQERIVDAATKEMQSRGLRMNTRRPDVLIKYTARVSNAKQTYRDPVYYQPAPAYYGGYFDRAGRYYYRYRQSFPIYVGDKERTVTYKAGTIVIDVIDRASSKVVWRGWSEGQVSDAQEATEDINSVVKNIFDKYPVKGIQ